jgi:hypothetical protein
LALSDEKTVLKSTLDAVHASNWYRQAGAERREASQRREAASARLDLAWVHERAAEIGSQHDPLGTAIYALIGGEDRMTVPQRTATYDEIRALCVAVGRYVSMGHKIEVEAQS